MGSSSREGWGGKFLTDAVGADLKAEAQKPGGWNMSMNGFGECLPYADNRVTLNTDAKDKWGRNTLTIDCEFKENEKAMQQDMAQ